MSVSDQNDQLPTEKSKALKRTDATREVDAKLFTPTADLKIKQPTPKKPSTEFFATNRLKSFIQDRDLYDPTPDKDPAPTSVDENASTQPLTPPPPESPSLGKAKPAEVTDHNASSNQGHHK